MYQILVVDDERIERNGIKMLLRHMQLPCEIAEAANGRDALEYLKMCIRDSMKTLIDGYITPLLGQANPDYSELLQAIIKMGILYVIGIAATFGNTKIMVYVTQGTMRNIRNDMFKHMESLPIKYFDTHKHGDIMSMYTNDVDTLRQMVSQSIPQFINSLISIVNVLIYMIILSVPLTLVSIVMVMLVIWASKTAASKSGKFFEMCIRDRCCRNSVPLLFLNQEQRRKTEKALHKSARFS